jgi:small subunit ribosomal protein S4
MARYTGPKNKLARRESQDLGLKTQGSAAHTALQKRLNILPGQHGVKMRFRRQPSDYAVRLREKQKAKRMYGVYEKQFRRYVENSVAERENTIDILVQQLERRLDNVVYRLNFAPTRAAARQLVSHRHIKVNNKTLNIPSYQVKVQDQIKLSSKARAIPAILSLLEEKNPNIPGWLTKGQVSGKIKALPGKDSVQEPIDWQLIIEYYTR